MLDNVIRLAVPHRASFTFMPPPAVDPRLERADWLEARLDALPGRDEPWPTDRAAAEDALLEKIGGLPDLPGYTTDASPWGALHSLEMLGIAALCEDSFEAMCRAWIAKARKGVGRG
jgi:hypothetical protein